MVTRLTTTSTATMAKVPWLPVHFATKDEKAVKNLSIPPSLWFTLFEWVAPVPTFPGRHPAKGLAPNEVEDHEYNDHQHDDANDPDTSKSSNHGSSVVETRPTRTGLSSISLLAREEPRV
jgi:hypothetical protein